MASYLSIFFLCCGSPFSSSTSSSSPATPSCSLFSSSSSFFSSALPHSSFFLLLVRRILFLTLLLILLLLLYLRLLLLLPLFLPSSPLSKLSLLVLWNTLRYVCSFNFVSVLIFPELEWVNSFYVKYYTHYSAPSRKDYLQLFDFTPLSVLLNYLLTPVCAPGS